MHGRMLFLGVIVVGLVALGLGGTKQGAKAEAGDSISGVIYFDTDMDGKREAGELPAPGASVELLGPTKYEIAVSDSEGRYSFTGLQPYNDIDYTLRMRLDSVIPCATTTTFAQDVPNGVDSTGVDFGVFNSGTKQVSGTLLNDLNEKGVDDAHEPALEGWQVRIYGQGGREGNWWEEYCDIRTTSDGAGQFTVDKLLAGRFFLELTPPPSLAEALREKTFTVPDTMRLSDDLTTPVDLTQTAESQNVKVGLHFLEGTAAISGKLFRDDDQDGAWDEGEVNFCQSNAVYAMGDYVNIFRDVPGLGMLHVTPGRMTCDHGVYRIGGLQAGSYDLDFMFSCYRPPDAPTPAYDPSSQHVTLSEGQHVDNVDVAGCTIGPAPTPPPAVAATPLATGTLQPIAWLGAPNTGSGGASDAAGRGGVLAALLMLGAVGGLAAGSALAARTRQR